MPHSNDRISTNKWLVDELRVELLLSTVLDVKKCMTSTLMAVCTSEEVLAHKKDIY
jgi:hypothetical protein